MNNFGQVCICTDYVLCHKSKLKQFVDKVKTFLAENYKDCKTPEWSGKMVNEYHYKRVCALLKDHGGQILYGNGNAYKDFNLTPTIILNPDKNSQLMKEEIFGPILPIFTYENFDEAINYIKFE